MCVCVFVSLVLSLSLSLSLIVCVCVSVCVCVLVPWRIGFHEFETNTRNIAQVNLDFGTDIEDVDAIVMLSPLVCGIPHLRELGLTLNHSCGDACAGERFRKRF